MILAVDVHYSRASDILSQDHLTTDPSAPILARADYAVIGDLAEVIPALVAALKERP